MGALHSLGLVLCGVLLVNVFLEFVAAMLAVGAVRTLVLRLAPALQRHVPHEVLARVVTSLAVGTLVALLSLVLGTRQGRVRRQDVVRRRRRTRLAMRPIW